MTRNCALTGRRRRYPLAPRPPFPPLSRYLPSLSLLRPWRSRIPRSSLLWVGMILSLPVSLPTCHVAHAGSPRLDCDPCVDRPSHTVRAIVHGTTSSRFWRQVRSAAVQSARDMRVNLHMDLYDEFDTARMAADIRRVVTEAHRAGIEYADPLVVTIPSPEVEEAVRIAIEAGMTVFGMNSGYDVASSLGMDGFVAMDEYVGGREAAREILDLLRSSDSDGRSKNVTRMLFVIHEKGNSAMDQRLAGFSDFFQQRQRQSTRGSSNSSLLEENGRTVLVDELVVDNSFNDSSTIESYLEGCPYNAVMLGGSATLEITTSAFYANGCPLGPQHTLLATFDTNSDVYDAIAVGKLSFAVSQQQHLQGALSVLMAAIHATTGKKLAPPLSTSDSGVYLSGPSIISLRNLPSDTLQTCEDDGFPVCPKEMSPHGAQPSRCKCADRRNIRIGGVLHGVSSDSFWNLVFAASRQAAEDVGVELDLKRFVPEVSDEVLHAKMANRIESLCLSGVDGVFVTIPSDDLVEAIRTCQALDIPVVSINSGASASKELGLVHHISQPEYSAGYSAGRKLVEDGMKKGYCLNHYFGNPALTERCSGFEDAIRDASDDSVVFLGVLPVPLDSAARFKKVVEDAIEDEGGGWDGVGLLLLGPASVQGALSLHSDHPDILIGSFDTSPEMFAAMDEHIILFGISQGEYLQGYMPIPLLAWMVQTKQALASTMIETGPSFVESSPSQDQDICEANFFRACPRPEQSDWNQIAQVRPVGLTLCAIILLTSLAFIAWVVWHRKYRVVRSSQPIFLIMICVGTFIMGLTIIPLSIDDGVASPGWCSIACTAAPWLFTIGFTVAFSALFSKIWRVNRIFASANRFRRVKVHARDVMLPFLLLLSLNIVFLLTWTLVDPMYWTRVELFHSEDLQHSYGYCALGSSRTSTALLASALAVNMCAVILANIQAYKARKITLEFNESKYVAMIMMCMLQIAIIGVPLIVLVSENPPAKYFVMTGIIFVLSISMLLLIFVPKVIYRRKSYRRRRTSLELRRALGIDSGFEKDDVPSTSASTGIQIISTQNDEEEEITCLQLSEIKMFALTGRLEEEGIETEHLFDLFKEMGITIGTTTPPSNSSNVGLRRRACAATREDQDTIGKPVVFSSRDRAEGIACHTGTPLDPPDGGGEDELARREILDISNEVETENSEFEAGSVPPDPGEGGGKGQVGPQIVSAPSVPMVNHVGDLRSEG